MKRTLSKIALGVICAGSLYGCGYQDTQQTKDHQKTTNAFYDYGEIAHIKGIYIQSHLKKEWVDIDNDGDLDLAIEINGKFFLVENRINERK